MKPFLFDIAASKNLQKPRSGGLLGPTTGGGHSGQRFSIKDTRPKLPITTEKLDQLIKVQRMWMSCRLICVTS